MEHSFNAGQDQQLPAFSWLELTSSFFDEFSKIINPVPPAPEKTETTQSDDPLPDDKFRTYHNWKTGLNHINAFLQMITRQENRQGISESMVTFFEFLTQVTGDSSENILEFQTQLLNSISKIGEHTKAYNFDDVDRHVFESSRKLYENEFRKFHYIPKLGLPRFYLERISVMIDKYNVFQSYLNELIYLFFVPFEKTNRIMQTKIDEMMKQNDFMGDSTAFYNEWIKMLEGHYMTLLQSSDYTRVLKKTIDSLTDYRKSREEMLCLVLKKLPIPTNDEMDEVYKDLYMVKKQIRELSGRLDRITGQE